MEQHVRFSPPHCRVCECPVVAGGVLVSEVDLDTLSEWWLLHLDTQLDVEDLEDVWICHFCTWKERMEHESPKLVDHAEHNNCDWWTSAVLEIPVYKYFYQGFLGSVTIENLRNDVKEGLPMAPSCNALEEKSKLVDANLQGQLKVMDENKEPPVDGEKDQLVLGAEEEETAEDNLDNESQQDQAQSPVGDRGEDEEAAVLDPNKLDESEKIEKKCIEHIYKFQKGGKGEMAKQDNEMQIGVEDKEAPPEKIVADGGQEAQPESKSSKALEEESKVEDVNLKFEGQIEEFEESLKEKDKRIKIMVEEVKSMEKQLNEAIQAKSKADRTITILDEYMTILEAGGQEMSEEDEEAQDSGTTTEDDDESDYEPPRKRRSKMIPTVLRKDPTPLKVCATDPNKYDLGSGFLVAIERVDSLAASITMTNYVGKLMEYQYKNKREANKELSKYSLTGRAYEGSRKKYLPKKMYPFHKELFDAVNLKFIASLYDVGIAITRKLTSVHSMVTKEKKN